MMAIDRQLARMNKRQRWSGATRHAEYEGDAGYDLVADPGDATSALVNLQLLPGRWHLFADWLVVSDSTFSAYAALRLTDDEDWDPAGAPATDLSAHFTNGTTFRTDVYGGRPMNATVVVEPNRTQYAQLGITKVSGSNDINIVYARVFAIPG